MNSTELQPVVRALERFGLWLGEDIESAEDLAARVDVAARNFTVGRRKRKGLREQWDDLDD